MSWPVGEAKIAVSLPNLVRCSPELLRNVRDRRALVDAARLDHPRSDGYRPTPATATSIAVNGVSDGRVDGACPTATPPPT